MSLRWRVVALLAALVAILVGTTVPVALALNRFDAERALITDSLQPASGNARAILTAVIDQETGERGFVISGDPLFMKPYRDGRQAFAEQSRELETRFAFDEPVLNQLDRVRASVADWHRIGAEAEIRARRTGPPGSAEELVTSGRGRLAFDVVRAEIEALQRLIDNRLNMARNRAASAFETLRNTIVISRLLLVSLVLVTGVLLRYWLLVPVEALRASMRAVADGNLEQPVRATGPPEVAAIGHDAEAMRRRIVAELDAARSATEALDQHSPVVAGLRRELAAGSVAALNGVRVHGALHAAEGVLAGDWWDVVGRADGSTAMLVADVAGHGAEAGLVAARFKQRVTALLSTDLDLLAAFVAAADKLDDDDERFLSCLLVEVHPATGRLRWINAGHPSGLIAHGVGNDLVVRELGPTGPLIGAVEHCWTVEETSLAPGELLLAMTDGVVEARRGADEEFGTEGVLVTLRRMRQLSAQGTVTEIVQAVRGFADDWRRDDVTCVGLTLLER